MTNPFPNYLKKSGVCPSSKLLTEDGIYSLPSHLSEGAKNLIAKMLVTNSEERATIQQIYADPWFRIDLPDYLIPADIAQQLFTSKPNEQPPELDMSIVTKVAEVFPPPFILMHRVSAIPSKTSLITYPNPAKHPPKRPITSSRKQKPSINPPKKPKKKD